MLSALYCLILCRKSSRVWWNTTNSLTGSRWWKWYEMVSSITEQNIPKQLKFRRTLTQLWTPAGFEPLPSSTATISRLSAPTCAASPKDAGRKDAEASPEGTETWEMMVVPCSKLSRTYGNHMDFLEKWSADGVFSISFYICVKHWRAVWMINQQVQYRQFLSIYEYVCMFRPHMWKVMKHGISLIGT